MKVVTIAILSGVLLACSNNEQETCTDSHDAITTEIIVNSPKDSIPKSEFYYQLNEQTNSLDSLKNPYLIQKENLNTVTCNHQTPRSQRLLCVLNQFQKANLPVHVGPTHDIPILNKRELADSLFIDICLDDKNYSTENERMYSYLNGKIIDSTENYFLVLVAEEFSVGKSFLLLSISTKNFELIDETTLGSESSDVRSIYGKITDPKHFEIQTKTFGYDEKNDLLYFETEITRNFEITKEGIFVAIEHIGT